MPLVDGGVVLHAGIAALPGGLGNFAHEVASLIDLGRFAALYLAGSEVLVALDGAHELVVHTNGVVGILEEDGAVGFRVRTGAVIAGLHQGPGFHFFLGLALDELGDIRMVDVQNDHLGGAAGLAAGLDDAGEGIEAAHKAQRPAGGATAGEGFHGSADAGKVSPGTRSPLEEHAFGLGQGQDGIERIVDRVDEAGGALGTAVAGHGELDRAAMGIPMPVLGIRIGLQPLAADVEPDGRVEGRFLGNQQVDQLVMEGSRVFRGGKIAARYTPVTDGLCDPGDELADTGFASAKLTLGSANVAVEVLGSDDVGGGHRPVGGNLDVFLLEDGPSAGIGDGSCAAFPGDLAVGGNAWLGEEAGAVHAGGGLWLRHRLAVVGGPAVLSGGSYGIGGLGH